MSLALIVVAILAVLLYMSFQQSVANEKEAVAARNTSEANLYAAWEREAQMLAASSREQLQADIPNPRLALLLALEGLAHYKDGVYFVENHQALLNALNSPGIEIMRINYPPSNNAEWSPDHRRLLTYVDHSSMFGAFIRDAETGEVLAHLPYDGILMRAEWDHDGTRVLTWGQYDDVLIWDTRPDSETFGRVLGTITHESTYTDAVWNAYGTRLITHASDGSLRLWDTASNSETFGEQLRGFEGGVHIAKWSPDGSRLLISDKDHFMVLDSVLGDTLLTLSRTNTPGWVVQWSNDSRYLLMITNEDDCEVDCVFEVRVVDVVDEKTAGNVILSLPHPIAIRQAIWNADNTRLLTYADEGLIWLWDTDLTSSESVTVGDLLLTLDHGGKIRGDVWTDDLLNLLTWNNELSTSTDVWPTLAIWNLKTLLESEDREPETLVTEPRLRLSLESDMLPIKAIWTGCGLLTWSPSHNIVQVRNAISGEISLILEHDQRVHFASCETRGRILTVTQETIHLWDLSVGDEFNEASIRYPGPGLGLVWSAEDSQFLTWGGTSTDIWSTDSDNPTYSQNYPLFSEQVFWTAQPFYTLGATWNADETRLLNWAYNSSSWAAYNAAAVYDVEQGSPTFGKRLLELVPELPIHHAMWSADESVILTMTGSQQDEEYAVQIWDAKTGELLHTLSADGFVHGAAWTADNRYFLTWEWSGNICIWDAIDYSQKVTLVHAYPVGGSAWVAADTTIIAWTVDAKMNIWDVRDIGSFSGEMLIEPIRQFSGLANLPGDGMTMPNGSWNSNYTAFLAVGYPGLQVLDFAPSSISPENYADLRLQPRWERDFSSTGGHATWSADAKWIISWEWRGNDVTIRDATTGAELLILRHRDSIDHAVLSHDKTRVLTLSGGEVRLWLIDLRNLIAVAENYSVPPLTYGEAQKLYLPVTPPTFVSPSWMVDWMTQRASTLPPSTEIISTPVPMTPLSTLTTSLTSSSYTPIPTVTPPSTAAPVLLPTSPVQPGNAG